ncbi:hypothetical protein GCM10011514_37600 [Emticicia aquatilis]|uniref:Prokaryotic RING finger family 4 n=1 Tax=Emticicia aquatilis TaxID=1537369 RepID=A0A917DTP5_9BACT|nr:hypothetical protein [Emticicia aquatilis]GGD70020.1 hypothetical protein GCM10011514_37600 [Emticicia aquatilis]
MKKLLKVSLRQNAIFIANASIIGSQKELKGTTSVLVANLSKLGFDVSEPLLKALNQTSPQFQLEVLKTFQEVMGANKNWTPLVKGWDVPTGETITDHIITYFVNIFGGKGTRLGCGHIIPVNTFPLERYNGCPFCGTPFEFGKIENYGQGSKKKTLELLTEEELESFLKDLLTSKTALDATQVDSLKILLTALPLPTVQIGMKETLMIVIDTFIAQNQADKASVLFNSPNEILRYLWYKHTGFLQIIEPKTIVKRHAKNNKHLGTWLDTSGKARFEKIADLKLKYSRKESLMVAKWLNNLDLDADKACEIMHPKRGMWIRFIRALRLAEYSKRVGFENLAALLDTFYNKTYEVWQGKVNHYRLKSDDVETFRLLKQRPGLFARSLFANMLWFGADETLAAFSEVIDKVPARLVFTLNMYAQNYFNPNSTRAVKPLGGVAKHIPANQLLDMYDAEQLAAMQSKIEDLCLLAMKKRFEKIENPNKTMFIDPQLFKIPVAIGDRSDSIQDLPVALVGTRFAVEGDTVRLFMQWGQGLPAQHMDMDLSCQIAYDNSLDFCSYSQLRTKGCKHSGDMRSIPNRVGTAEYIDLNISKLEQEGAKFVSFVCNAYSNGSITPNMIVGWMNSNHPMRISESTGVAYDPSCVQHQVRITQGLAKGLVFGVLDVKNREIIWLEMPFQGQVVQELNLKGINALLAKLNAKLTIGNLLTLKAEAQNLTLIEADNADESYTMQWAINAANVTKLLVD